MSAKKKRKVASQWIVVDATVLKGASSTDGGPPRGVACRRALLAILDICHRAVVSPALEKEYQDNPSKFGQKWRVAMMRRNMIVRTLAKETGRARGWMQSPVFTERERPIAAKDLHLVLAAWEKEAVILSGDDTSRALFARLADLKDLGWARMTGDDVLAWLEGGALPHVVALGV